MTALMIESSERAAYLGAGYSDLRPGVDVHSTVSLPGDGAAHCVGDTHSQSPSFLTVAQGHQAVSSLPWRIGRHGNHHGLCNVIVLKIKLFFDLFVCREIAFASYRTQI